MSVRSTVTDLWPLLLLGVDWLVDKLRKKKTTKDIENAVGAVRKSLRELGTPGDRVVSALDDAIAEGKLKRPRGWKPTQEPP
jgi:hypothetical protein